MNTGHGNARVRYPGHYWAIVVMSIASIIIAANGTFLSHLYDKPNSKLSLYKPMVRKVHAGLGLIIWAGSKWAIHIMEEYIELQYLKYCYLIGRVAVPLFVVMMELYKCFWIRGPITEHNSKF